MSSRPEDGSVESPSPADEHVVSDAASPEVAPDTEAAPVPDAELLNAHDLALAALGEITPAATIGEPVGHRVEADGVVSLLFATTLAGYPGWFWTVSLARVPGEEPTVLEVELLPGDGALVAPEWVPWAVRLADYQAQLAVDAAKRAEDESEESDDDEDDDDEELAADAGEDLDDDDSDDADDDSDDDSDDSES